MPILASRIANIEDTGEKSLLVSHHILALRWQIDTTPMQLIKLVYICHGGYLWAFNKPLLDEPVEAWRYGPVVPTVYHAFKNFRDRPIRLKATRQTDLSSSEQHAISVFAKAHREYSGIQLSSMTHAPGTPWDRTVKDVGEGAVIPNELIRDYYVDLLGMGSDFVNEEDKEIERIAKAMARVLRDAKDDDIDAKREAASFSNIQASEIDSLRRELDKHYATKEYVLSRLNAKAYLLIGLGATVLAAVISGLFRVLFP